MKQIVPCPTDPQTIPSYSAENSPIYQQPQNIYQNNMNSFTSQVQPNNNYSNQIGMNFNPPIISNYPIHDITTNMIQNCNKEITLPTPIYNQVQLNNVPIQPQLNHQFIQQPQQLINNSQNNQFENTIPQTQPSLIQIQQVKSFPLMYNRQQQQQQQQQQQPFYPNPMTQINYNRNTWDVNVNTGRNIIPTGYTNINSNNSNNKPNLMDSNFNSKPMTRFDSGNSIINYVHIPNNNISYQYPIVPAISTVNSNNNTGNDNRNNDNEHKITTPRMVFGSPIWTAEEDDLLLRLKDVENLNWRDISLYFPSRTINACQFRWRRLVIKKQNKIKREARRALKEKNLKKGKKAGIKKDKIDDEQDNNVEHDNEKVS